MLNTAVLLRHSHVYSIYICINKPTIVKKIYVLVLKSYLGPLVMTFFIAMFVLDMQFLWKYIDDLVGKGLEWYLIFELLFYASATVVPLALPLAILLSSLMTFGNLGEHYELVSMKAAGVSLQKAMRPLVVVSILISLLAFYFSNNVLPVANLKFQSLYFDIREKKLAFNIREGVFYNELDGYTIRIGHKESDDIHIKDVTIYNHSEGLGNIEVSIAKSGKMETTPDGRYMIFTLYDGYNYKEKVDEAGHRRNRPFERSTFKEQYKKFDLGNFEMNHTDEALFKDHYMMLNIKQLVQSIDSLELKAEKEDEKFADYFKANLSTYTKLDSAVFLQKDTTKITDILSSLKNPERRRLIHESLTSAQTIALTINRSIGEKESARKIIIKRVITIHEKFTLSFACLILFFIGAPMGAIIRKGGLGFPVVVSVIFFIIFHIASITGKKYVLAGILVPEIGMWLATALLLPIGIFLTYKATNDSPVLDADNYRRIYQVLLKIIRKTD